MMRDTFSAVCRESLTIRGSACRESLTSCPNRLIWIKRIVIPVKTGNQDDYELQNNLDPGVHRGDEV